MRGYQAGKHDDFPMKNGGLMGFLMGFYGGLMGFNMI